MAGYDAVHSEGDAPTEAARTRWRECWRKDGTVRHRQPEKRMLNDPVLEVTDTILFRGGFVAIAFQRSADQVAGAESDRQGEREHNAAK